MNGDAERWQKLQARLAAAGIPAAVSTRPFPGGITRFIWIHAENGAVQIHDSWWPKNPDIWTGWQVWREDAQGYTRFSRNRLKKYSEVVAAVKDMLERVGSVIPATPDSTGGVDDTPAIE